MTAVEALRHLGSQATARSALVISDVKKLSLFSGSHCSLLELRRLRYHFHLTLDCQVKLCREGIDLWPKGQVSLYVADALVNFFEIGQPCDVCQTEEVRVERLEGLHYLLLQTYLIDSRLTRERIGGHKLLKLT